MGIAWKNVLTVKEQTESLAGKMDGKWLIKFGEIKN
jgi:hypothetical protein